MLDIDCCRVIQNVDAHSEIEKTFAWILPFFLGLLSSLILDFFRFSIRKRKLKKFTIKYLRNDIQPELPKLVESYKRVKEHIESNSTDKIKYYCFVSFNNLVLNGLSSSDYYDIFKKKFSLLNSITSEITFISNNLPGDIFEDYYSFINNHLKDVKVTNPVHHIDECLICKQRRNITIGNIELRLSEIDTLDKEISQLIRK
jgi:hypothetical protein